MSYYALFQLYSDSNTAAEAASLHFLGLVNMHVTFNLMYIMPRKMERKQERKKNRFTTFENMFNIMKHFEKLMAAT